MSQPGALTAIELPTHPDPVALAADLERLAKNLRTYGTRRLDLARQLAAVGYPSSTLGSGGGRSSDSTSTTERAAGIDHDRPHPNRWAQVDVVYATRLADLARSARAFDQVDALVAQHASDVDPIPAGSGECLACDRVVRHDPVCRPDWRLRSGLCPTDRKAWQRAGSPHPIGDWVRKRRAELTDSKGKLRPPVDG